MTALIQKFFRFSITGAVGMCIDFGVTYTCKEKLKWNKFWANATGFTLAVINNYLLNRVWTFGNKDPHVMLQFTWFVLISLLGLGLNTAILFFVHEKKKMGFYLSKLIATAFVVCWNFAANSSLTFRHG